MFAGKTCLRGGAIAGVGRRTRTRGSGARNLPKRAALHVGADGAVGFVVVVALLRVLLAGEVAAAELRRCIALRLQKKNKGNEGVRQEVGKIGEDTGGAEGGNTHRNQPKMVAEAASSGEPLEQPGGAIHR